MASWSFRPERVMAPALLASLALFGTSTAWGGGCDTTCPGGALSIDTDVCTNDDDLLNGGCNVVGEGLGDLGTLTSKAPITFCGTVGAYINAVPEETRDLDWYTFHLDGPTRVTFNSVHAGENGDPEVVLFLRENLACAEQVTVNSLGTLECPASITADLPAGDHVIIFTVNSFGDDNAANVCDIAYVGSLTGEALPEICATSSNPCDLPAGSGGCEDLTCCADVCASDDFCCNTSWDEVCVKTAIDVCGLFIYECENPGPANDCATSPQVVDAGDVVAFDTTLANTDGPDQPECGSANNDTPVHKDVWYAIVAPGDGLLNASVCGTTDFDTKIAAYDLGVCTVAGGCLDPAELQNIFVDCNEDSGTCAFFTSALQVDAVAGHTYLFRLGGYEGASGIGTISFGFNTVIYFNGPPRAVIFNNNIADPLGQSNGSLSAAQPQRWNAEKVTMPALPEGGFTHWKINELQPQGFLAGAPTVTENAGWRIWTHISDTQAPTPADELYSGVSTGVPFLGDSLIVNLADDDVLLEPGVPYWINVHGQNTLPSDPFVAANFAWFMNPEFGENLINPATQDAFTWRSAMYPTPGFLMDAAATIVQSEGLDPLDRYNHSIAILGTPVKVGDQCEVNSAAGCSADVNDSGQVDGADLGQLLLDFGVNDGCPTGKGDTLFSTNIAGDDEVVNGADLGQLLLQFTGNPCP